MVIWGIVYCFTHIVFSVLLSKTCCCKLGNLTPEDDLTSLNHSFPFALYPYKVSKNMNFQKLSYWIPMNHFPESRFSLPQKVSHGHRDFQSVPRLRNLGVLRGGALLRQSAHDFILSQHLPRPFWSKEIREAFRKIPTKKIYTHK